VVTHSRERRDNCTALVCGQIKMTEINQRARRSAFSVARKVAPPLGKKRAPEENGVRPGSGLS
jgi:hypothetical protein